jgi:hypothetical protein
MAVEAENKFNSAGFRKKSKKGLSLFNGKSFDYFPPPAGLIDWSFAYPPSVGSLNNIFLRAELVKII